MSVEGKPKIEERKPVPAESFEIDFLNEKGVRVRNAMGEIGDFIFRSSGVDGGDVVFFEGEREDGTTIRIEVKKGDGYRTPLEIVKEGGEDSAE